MIVQTPTIKCACSSIYVQYIYPSCRTSISLQWISFSSFVRDEED